MHSLLVSGVALTLALRVIAPDASAESAPVPPLPESDRELFFVGTDSHEITPARVERFLASRGSPLAAHARRIVAAGVRYGVDPRWIVAISGTETNFGLYHTSFNAWGWDAPNGLRRWSSWDEAIEGYTRHFARGYRSRDPIQIGARYAPFTPHWPATTRGFFGRI
jgi:hypothetical protein